MSGLVLRVRRDGYNGEMIKGLTVVEPVGSADAFARLQQLFAALGFEAGKGWKDAEGEGAAFLAPVGNLELVTGRLPAVPRLLVEVTQLEQVRGRGRGGGRRLEAPKLMQ